MYVFENELLFEIIDATVHAFSAQTLTRTPPSINPQSVNLEENIERLKLDVERIIPVHYPADNRKVMDKELLIAVGKGN